MCKQGSREKSTHSRSEAQKLPSQHFKYLALFLNNTHLSDISKAERKRRKG